MRIEGNQNGTSRTGRQLLPRLAQPRRSLIALLIALKSLSVTLGEPAIKTIAVLDTHGLSAFSVGSTNLLRDAGLRCNIWCGSPTHRSLDRTSIPWPPITTPVGSAWSKPIAGARWPAFSRQCQMASICPLRCATPALARCRPFILMCSGFIFPTCRKGFRGGTAGPFCAGVSPARSRR
jgi:hypothetical protein